MLEKSAGLLHALELRLKRLSSLALPVTRWRVPVTMLHGQAPEGEAATLLVGGTGACQHYIASRFFAGEPRQEPLGRVPLWRLDAFLKEAGRRADLTAICLDRHSARLLPSQDWLRSPAWIDSRIQMQVQNAVRESARTSSSAARDLCAVRKNQFECVLSREAADFDIFYDKFYTSYILWRYQKHAQLSPRRGLRQRFKRGFILWVVRGGERLAGLLVTQAGQTLKMEVLGLANGREDLLRQGVLAALYVNVIRFAQQQGCCEVITGGSRPSLHDGLLRYKRKWGVSLCEKPEMNFELLLHWNHLSETVANFLSHTSIIHRDGGGFSALWAYPQHLPLTEERLAAEVRAIHTPGLRCLRILPPAQPPQDIKLPSGVEWLDLRSSEVAGGDFIRTLRQTS